MSVTGNPWSTWIAYSKNLAAFHKVVDKIYLVCTENDADHLNKDINLIVLCTFHLHKIVTNKLVPSDTDRFEDLGHKTNFSRFV